MPHGQFGHRVEHHGHIWHAAFRGRSARPLLPHACRVDADVGAGLAACVFVPSPWRWATEHFLFLQQIPQPAARGGAGSLHGRFGQADGGHFRQEFFRRLLKTLARRASQGRQLFSARRQAFRRQADRIIPRKLPTATMAVVVSAVQRNGSKNAERLERPIALKLRCLPATAANYRTAAVAVFFPRRCS